MAVAGSDVQNEGELYVLKHLPLFPCKAIVPFLVIPMDMWEFPTYLLEFSTQLWKKWLFVGICVGENFKLILKFVGVILWTFVGKITFCGTGRKFSIMKFERVLAHYLTS